eukprot:gnl/MRDRNA2_/MRDRNA2_113123_c0_seq1.p1 gnl/MRDRNA2_/MRDRNA2_113123_c0~~gnl/MRDRNA2_/MRDRNA2_113123_c0_seq1.p1  ORF type:complete len:2404 (-),score=572.50 gnl/MRDRNA2_/MRDRNA2_113123_c0_seq1:86-6589(-)
MAPGFHGSENYSANASGAGSGAAPGGGSASPERRPGASQSPSEFRQRGGLTAQHFTQIEEVLQEQRRLRNQQSGSSETTSSQGDPRFALHPAHGPGLTSNEPWQTYARPPSRGGESWQPLGHTTPPAYETAIPEEYQQFEQLIPSSDQHIDDFPMELPAAPRQHVPSTRPPSAGPAGHVHSPRHSGVDGPAASRGQAATPAPWEAHPAASTSQDVARAPAEGSRSIHSAASSGRTPAVQSGSASASEAGVAEAAEAPSGTASRPAATTIKLPMGGTAVASEIEAVDLAEAAVQDEFEYQYEDSEDESENFYSLKRRLVADPAVPASSALGSSGLEFIPHDVPTEIGGAAVDFLLAPGGSVTQLKAATAEVEKDADPEESFMDTVLDQLEFPGPSLRAQQDEGLPAAGSPPLTDRERARRDGERMEQARLEKERERLEKERIASERQAERDRLEVEREHLEKERQLLDRERVERERLERLAQEQADLEAAKKERADREMQENVIEKEVEREREEQRQIFDKELDKERHHEREQKERDRELALAVGRERERLEKERDRLEKERERVERERKEQERLERDPVRKEQKRIDAELTSKAEEAPAQTAKALDDDVKLQTASSENHGVSAGVAAALGLRRGRGPHLVPSGAPAAASSVRSSSASASSGLSSKDEYDEDWGGPGGRSLPPLGFHKDLSNAMKDRALHGTQPPEVEEESPKSESLKSVDHRALPKGLDATQGVKREEKIGSRIGTVGSPDVGKAPHRDERKGRQAPDWQTSGSEAQSRAMQSEEEGDASSGTSASNAWLGSPGHEGTALREMMRHSQHKHMIRKLIPSFPSPDDQGTQHSAPSSTRSLHSAISSSSSAVGSNGNEGALAGDRFSQFTMGLASKIDQEEEARVKMVEQLFRLQQKALEKKVKEKLRVLKSSSIEHCGQKSPRWVEKRVRQVKMRADAEHADIERQLAESKALHARRKLRLSEMEHQVYSWRSSALRLKKGRAKGGDLDVDGENRSNSSSPISTPSSAGRPSTAHPKFEGRDRSSSAPSGTERPAAATDQQQAAAPIDRLSTTATAGVTDDEALADSAWASVSSDDVPVTGVAVTGDASEESINQRLQKLKKDMEGTTAEIHGTRNLKQKELKLKKLQRQKEEAKLLYAQKQELVRLRMRQIELQQEEESVNKLLDEALSLNVDEEVQRRIEEKKPSPTHAALDSGKGGQDMPGGTADADGHGENLPAELEESLDDRDRNLAELRTELAEKRREIQLLQAERKKQRQSREEQKLRRALERMTDEFEKLRQPSSDESSAHDSSNDGTDSPVKDPASATNDVEKGSAKHFVTSGESLSPISVVRNSASARTVALAEDGLQKVSPKASPKRKTPMFASGLQSVGRESPRASPRSDIIGGSSVSDAIDASSLLRSPASVRSGHLVGSGHGEAHGDHLKDSSFEGLDSHHDSSQKGESTQDYKAEDGDKYKDLSDHMRDDLREGDLLGGQRGLSGEDKEEVYNRKRDADPKDDKKLQQDMLDKFESSEGSVEVDVCDVEVGKDENISLDESIEVSGFKGIDRADHDRDEKQAQHEDYSHDENKGLASEDDSPGREAVRRTDDELRRDDSSGALTENSVAVPSEETYSDDEFDHESEATSDEATKSPGLTQAKLDKTPTLRHDESLSSSEATLLIEEVEVSEGEQGYSVDEWHAVAPATKTSDKTSEKHIKSPPPQARDVATAPTMSSRETRSTRSTSEALVAAMGPLPPILGRTGTRTASGPAQFEFNSVSLGDEDILLRPGSGGGKITEELFKSDSPPLVLEDPRESVAGKSPPMITSDGPLEDKLSTEPALRHPTPRTGVSIAEILAEDGASASDSTHSDGVGSDRGTGSPPLAGAAPNQSNKGSSSPPTDTSGADTSDARSSSLKKGTEQDELCGTLVNEVLDDLLLEVWDELKSTVQGADGGSRLACTDDLDAAGLIDSSEDQVEVFVNAMMKALACANVSDLVPEKINTSNIVPLIIESIYGKVEEVKTRKGKSAAKSGREDQQAWIRLQTDMVQEIVSAEPEVQADSKWRKSPLALFQAAKFGDHSQDPMEQRTWVGAKRKLKKDVAIGFSPHLLNSNDERGPSLSSTLMNEDSLDMLLENEINSDEKNWLNIDFDVKQVHHQITRMIFQELVDEAALEVQKIYSAK